MKKLITLFTLTLVFGLNASADQLFLRCTGAGIENCETRAAAALTKMSCEPSQASCQLENEVDGDGKPNGEAIYCTIRTEKCAEAKPYLFGGTYCDNGGSKVSMAGYDGRLTLSYSTGFFRAWVRNICVTK